MNWKWFESYVSAPFNKISDKLIKTPASSSTIYKYVIVILIDHRCFSYILDDCIKFQFHFSSFYQIFIPVVLVFCAQLMSQNQTNQYLFCKTHSTVIIITIGVVFFFLFLWIPNLSMLFPHFVFHEVFMRLS